METFLRSKNYLFLALNIGSLITSSFFYDDEDIENCRFAAVYATQQLFTNLTSNFQRFAWNATY